MKAGTLAGPKAWLGALALLGAAMPAMAQPPLRLDTQMFVERVTTDLNGRPRRILASANRLTPGDQLIVLLHWRNEGSAPLRAAAVTRALPRGVELDLSDPAMQLSVDGGVHWGRLDQLWLPTPLGGTRRAVAADITHVRWTLPHAPAGHAGRLSYRATIR
ncbi:MAG TPA: hypothetical protein DCG90_03135 [Sphingobium sp.]|jgi:hypothetical protein|uniref:hypothetical protein n=1 Tax=unclassified Sphingobium TaxID=2611147 RepID=UPI0007F3410E|nr:MULTISPECIES: hypothetical protein [unclassified Sphingobium]OAN59011.1 hypothetical protein A7Q26_12255 [Sphingobium sp. TCM1]HAF40748.1 hypothetical protein [Sphingobium sp.]